MKTQIALTILYIGTLILPFTSNADTPEEFLAAYRSAIEAKDTNHLVAMYYTVGCTEADKQMLPVLQQIKFSNSKIKDISYQPLPPHQQNVSVVNGKKYDPTYLPIGIIQISYDNAGNRMMSGGDGYAVINGKYYLTTTKSTDLNWTGPKDQLLNISAVGNGQNTLQLQYAWNASGVNLTNTIDAPSVVFPGQFIESAKVTSTNENTDVVITISENGKGIFSKSLKGSGIVEYQKQR